MSIKRNYSIEYAHIYTNMIVGQEQQVSIKVLKECQRHFVKNGENPSFTVLIDDYSFPEGSFNYSEFNNWLIKQGIPPDVIMQESYLIPQCDKVLSIITKKSLKKKLESYVKSNRYPCSLFIAAWYLLRLGKLRHPKFPKKYYAKRLINILPESFKPYEDKALQIISKTIFKGSEKMIEHRYFTGKKIII